jgi:hypothetical protein
LKALGWLVGQLVSLFFSCHSPVSADADGSLLHLVVTANEVNVAVAGMYYS